jgi:hypothetical protein
VSIAVSFGRSGAHRDLRAGVRAEAVSVDRPGLARDHDLVGSDAAGRDSVRLDDHRVSSSGVLSTLTNGGMEQQ